MAVSDKNQLGVGGARKLSALEAQLPYPTSPAADQVLYGVQPFGVLDGRYDQVTTPDLLGRLGTDWIQTLVGSGTSVVQAATATQGPFVRFTTDANANDNNQIQYARAITAGSTTVTAAGGAIFIPGAGYDIVFKARFRITSTVANCCLHIGLPIVDTTLISAAAIGVTECISFTKAAASASLLGNMRVGSSSTTVTQGTVVINTWHEVGFRLQGVSGINYYFDGTWTGSTTMTNIPTAVLCPSIAIATNTTAAAVLEVDSFYVGKEMR